MEWKVRYPCWKPLAPQSKTRKFWQKHSLLFRKRYFITTLNSFCLTDRDLVRKSSQRLGLSFRDMLSVGKGFHQGINTFR